jgi:hypothetical protein
MKEQYQMKHVCLVTLAMCLLCIFSGCSKQPDNGASSGYPHIIFWENNYRIGDSLWYVWYGTCDASDDNSVEQLTFVLFESGSLDNPPGIRRVVRREVKPRDGSEGTNKQEGYLIDNFRRMIQLPTETQLYEIVDGKLSTRPDRVSLAQIKDYLESKPNEYTLESLLKYSTVN